MEIRTLEPGLLGDDSESQAVARRPFSSPDGAAAEEKNELEHGNTQTHAPAEEPGVLKRIEIQKGLSTLGHNHFGQIVLTRCDLVNMGLHDISLLAEFPFLQRLSLDKNELTDLKPLAALSNLVYLSARENQLTESVFDDIASHAQNLERLHLDHNQLASLHGLQQLMYLIDFSAPGNGITCVEARDVENLHCLMRLHLSDNKIAQVELHTFSGAPNVRVLDMGHNEIEDILFVSYLTENLETLLLGGNHIKQLGTSLSSCASLMRLDISNNEIDSLELLRPLTFVKTLRFFSVSGNKCAETFTSPLTAALSIGENAAAAAGGPPSAVGHAGKTEDGENTDEVRPMSRSELVMADAAAQPHELSRDTTEELQKSLEEPNVTTHYAKLASSKTTGALKGFLTAKPALQLPEEMDKAAELKQMPAELQAHLWLLHTFPQLRELNGEPVDAAEVGKANFFFESVHVNN